MAAVSPANWASEEHVSNRRRTGTCSQHAWRLFRCAGNRVRKAATGQTETFPLPLPPQAEPGRAQTPPPHQRNTKEKRKFWDYQEGTRIWKGYVTAQT